MTNDVEYLTIASSFEVVPVCWRKPDRAPNSSSGGDSRATTIFRSGVRTAASETVDRNSCQRS